MTKEKLIFEGGFYSDLPLLKENVLSPEDLFVKIETPMDFSCFWNGNVITMSVVEILLMNLEFLESFKTKEKNKGVIKFSLIEFYNDTVICLDFLSKKFPSKFKRDIDYQNYIKFIFDDDVDYIDETEVQELISKGYRTIDLKAINFGFERNEKEIKRLIKLGANPMINSWDLSEKTYKDSELYSELTTTIAYDELDVLYNYNSRTLKKISNQFGAYYLIQSLYNVASSYAIFKHLVKFKIDS